MKLPVFVILTVISLTSLRIDETSAGPTSCAVVRAHLLSNDATTSLVVRAFCSALSWIQSVKEGICKQGASASSTGAATQAARSIKCRRRRGAVFDDEDPWMRSQFSQFDTNNDGFLSLDDVAGRENRQKNSEEATVMEEFLAFPKWLYILDKNQDAKISPQEWDNGFRWTSTDDSLVVNLFSFVDTNRDGGISLTELIQVSKSDGLLKSLQISRSALNKLDKDGDSLISFSEFKTSLKNSLDESGLKTNLK